MVKTGACVLSLQYEMQLMKFYTFKREYLAFVKSIDRKCKANLDNHNRREKVTYITTKVMNYYTTNFVQFNLTSGRVCGKQKRTNITMDTRAVLLMR